MSARSSKGPWGFFWTTVGGVAAVIGAAAAVYPLLFTDQQFVHVTIDDELALRIETLSEPIILTGNWHISRTRRWWWDDIVFERGRDPFDLVSAFHERRVPANTSARTFITTIQPQQWIGVKHCSLAISQFELSLEFESKNGVRWAHAKLPFCVPRDAAVAYGKRGDVHAAKGEYGLAIAEYGKAIEMDWSYSTAHYKRGAAFEAISQDFFAAREYRNALSADPMHRPSKDALARLGVLP